MLIKENSKVYCHTSENTNTSLGNKIFNEKIYTKGKYYIISGVCSDLSVFIKSDDCISYHFNYDNFQNHFFTLTNWRKQKLKKLYGKNR